MMFSQLEPSQPKEKELVKGSAEDLDKEFEDIFGQKIVEKYEHPAKEEKVAKKFYDPDNKNVVITGGTTEDKVKPCSILQQLAIDR